MKKLFLTILFCLFAVNVFAQIELKDNLYKTTLGKDKDEVIIARDNKPQVEFTKWNGENTLILKAPADLVNSQKVNFVNGRAEIKDDKVGWYANEDSDNTNNLKFGLVLYEIPDEKYLVEIEGEEYYEWQYQLQGWEEFDFLYQPPLKNLNPDGSTWEISPWGGTSTRPADVNGSYAIYHKTKANNQYKTGKFGHYYRPRFIDIEGKSVWADLNIENGIVTITIPQIFLDKAKYPIRANDTFGTTGIGGTDETFNGTNIWYIKASSTPASNGTLDSIEFYCSRSSATAIHNPGIYSDSAGTPNSRLAYADSGGTAAGASFAWVESTLSYGSIVSGTQYWLCTKSTASTNEFNIKYDTGSGNELYYESQANYPATASGSSLGAIRVSMFANYTPSGGGVIKTYNGLAWANIKTINGVAVANIKTINGAAAQ